MSIQSLTRASYLKGIHLRRNVLSAVFLFLTVTVSALAVGRFDVGRSDVVFFALYFAGSISFLQEEQLSRKRNIVLVNALEGSLIGACTFLFWWGNFSTVTVILAFTTNPVSKIIGYGISLICADNSRKEIPARGVGDRSLTMGQYVAYSVGQQIVCSTSAALPVLFFAYTGNFTTYTVALVCFRWINSLGALASMIINVVAARIFYRSIDISLFTLISKLAHRYDRWILVHVLTLLAFTGMIFAFSHGEAWLIVLSGISIGLLMVINFFSSIMGAFGRPDLSLRCQVIVFLVLAFSCAHLYELSWIWLTVLILCYILYIYTHRHVMVAFAEISNR